MKKIGVVIPAYNEAHQIGALTRNITSLGFSPLVVDDGSSDGTSEKARDNGAEVIRHEQNLGKGASLRTGFRHLLKKDYDAVLVMDGDGQHSADDIQKFIDAGGGQKSIMVIGNRMNETKNMPFDRKLTNMFMSFIMSLVCGQRIPDSQCGFRLITQELLRGIKIEYSRFEVESEILVKACRAGAKVVSVPVKTLYGKEASQINPFWDTWRFILFLLKLPFRRDAI